MIPIEELSIGNSVYLKDKVITIIDIYSSENKPSIYYYKEDGESYPSGTTIDEIEGIPLSNQSLGNILDEDYSPYCLRAKISTDHIEYFNNNNESAGFSAIKYVHQLQNAYKVLTGFTKTLDYDANTQSLSCRAL